MNVSPKAVQETAAFIRERQRAYKLAFGSPAGQAVMDDLAKFCRANETCFSPDPRVHAALEGRREVWLRIQQHIGLTNDQAFSLYTGLHPQVTQLEPEPNA